MLRKSKSIFYLSYNRQKQDRERQERLARERLAARRQKRQSDLDEAKESLKDKEKDDKPLVVEDGTDVAQLQVSSNK